MEPRGFHASRALALAGLARQSQEALRGHGKPSAGSDERGGSGGLSPQSQSAGGHGEPSGSDERGGLWRAKPPEPERGRAMGTAYFQGSM